MHAVRAIAAVSLVALGVSAALPQAFAAERPTVDLTKMTPPDFSKVGDDAFGKLVKYGHALFTDTANQIGPNAADPAKRYSGNQLTCQNCHMQGGAQAYAVPMVGIWGEFPQYRPREGEVGTLEERVNGCMQRSMNGRVLPLDSREMKAFLAYAKWLSAGIPVEAKLVGASLLPIKDPARAVDLKHGAQVYAQNCASCHGVDGQGVRAENGKSYQFPPLWGPDSYNDGAGMTRVLTLASFAKYNMPAGVTFQSPALSDEDAYDVGGYVNSQVRPHKADLDKDFPIRLQKPVDTGYGPYADGFGIEQHKFGPFGPIRAKVKELREQSNGH